MPATGCVASPQAPVSASTALALRTGLCPWDSIQHIMDPAEHSPDSTWTHHSVLATLQHFVQLCVFLSVAPECCHSKSTNSPLLGGLQHMISPFLQLAKASKESVKSSLGCIGSESRLGGCSFQLHLLLSERVRVMLDALTNKPQIVQCLGYDRSYFFPLLQDWCVMRSAGDHSSCHLWVPSSRMLCHLQLRVSKGTQGASQFQAAGEQH